MSDLDNAIQSDACREKGEVDYDTESEPGEAYVTLGSWTTHKRNRSLEKKAKSIGTKRGGRTAGRGRAGEINRTLFAEKGVLSLKGIDGEKKRKKRDSPEDAASGLKRNNKTPRSPIVKG